MAQLSHPYMTTGRTITLTRQTFVGKVMSLLFNMLSRLVIAFRKAYYNDKGFNKEENAILSNIHALNMPANLENSAVAKGL